jgi:HAD superfamily hydrolase (TIGR01509 family)
MERCLKLKDNNFMMKIILVDAKHCFIDSEGNIFKEMYKLLEKYPNKKIILTNADQQDINRLNLNKAPYEVFTLKYNPEKSDPRYYEIMLNNFVLKAEDVICFENKEESVQSAQAVGINTYHYDRDKKDLVALKNFIDQNL